MRVAPGLRMILVLLGGKHLLIDVRLGPSPAHVNKSLLNSIDQCPSLCTLPLFPVIVWAEQVWAGESAGLPCNFPAACACARPPSGPHRSR